MIPNPKFRLFDDLSVRSSVFTFETLIGILPEIIVLRDFRRALDRALDIPQMDGACEEFSKPIFEAQELLLRAESILFRSYRNVQSRYVHLQCRRTRHQRERSRARISGDRPTCVTSEPESGFSVGIDPGGENDG